MHSERALSVFSDVTVISYNVTSLFLCCAASSKYYALIFINYYFFQKRLYLFVCFIIALLLFIKLYILFSTCKPFQYKCLY